MVPIVTNGKQYFDEESLKKSIMETCENHKKEGRALAFAFIVYDFENHTIPEILKNKDYWSSLDKISGKRLSIFYINSQDEYYNQRQEEIYQEAQKRMSWNAEKGVMSYLVPITRKPTPTDNAIRYLRKEFEIEENINTPFVIFFQLNNDNYISDSFIVGLKKEKLEDAFLELRNHIRKAVNSLDKVLPENYGNHQEIFNLIKTEVESGKFYIFVNDKIKKNLTLGTLISIAKFFFGG